MYMENSKKFPKVKGRSLSGKKVTFPKDVEGEVVLIGIAFKREAQEMLDSWIDYFDILCEGKKDIYEIPMIESSIWKIFSPIINRGMRSGIPEERHDKVVTHYGGVSDVKEQLEIEDEDLGYVFLLDEHGQILFKGEGYADKEEKKELLEHIKDICSSDEEM